MNTLVVNDLARLLKSQGVQFVVAFALFTAGVRAQETMVAVPAGMWMVLMIFPALHAYTRRQRGEREPYEYVRSRYQGIGDAGAFYEAFVTRRMLDVPLEPIGTTPDFQPYAADVQRVEIEQRVTRLETALQVVRNLRSSGVTSANDLAAAIAPYVDEPRYEAQRVLDHQDEPLT